MKILVTGSDGQLGSELKDLSASYARHDFVFANRSLMPLDNLQQVSAALEAISPDLIINAGAYTAVDKAESEPQLADTVNHLAVAVMIEWACKNNRRIIHISTDYVFQGDSSSPLAENVPTNPINMYGKSKESAEKVILESNADAVIIRTAWVYSTYGNNFVKTMLKLMSEKDVISVIQDQVGSPTYAGDLAHAIFHIIDYSNWQPGIYHYSNEGETSWYEFAKTIKDIKGFHCEVVPISTAEYPTAAQRPKYSLLDKSKIKEVYEVSVPEWTESLKIMLNKI